jgi:hypothetical protein
MKFQSLETTCKMGLILAALHLQHMPLSIGKNHHKLTSEAQLLLAPLFSLRDTILDQQQATFILG